MRKIYNEKLVKKTFGIGVISLLLFTALLLPSVGATTIQQQNIDEITFAEIGMILKRNIPSYENDINEIMDYLDQYYKENGIFDEKFLFPENLQVKFEEITNEIYIQQNNYYGKITPQLSVLYENESLATSGGGITKAVGPFPYVYWIPFNFGTYYLIWLDDFTTRALSLGGPFIPLLSKLGHVGVILAIYIGFYIAALQLVNKGNGVRFRFHLPIFPAPLPWIGSIEPQ